MPDYRKMYFALFNAITIAIDQLKNAQSKGEHEYIESGEAEFTVLRAVQNEKPESNE